MTDRFGRAVYDVGLLPLGSWNYVFESDLDIDV
jgi:hypothetical protein